LRKGGEGVASLRELLEELVREMSGTPSGVDELAEKINTAKTIPAKLLEKAPLLILAAGWRGGDCKRMAMPVTLYPPRWEVDYNCLRELASYLNRNVNMVVRELNCRAFYVDYPAPTLTAKHPLETIASLLSGLRHYFEMLIHSPSASTSKVQWLLIGIQEKYIHLLAVLYYYCH
jgi:hypothetical protein